jgi:hypothetical protein
MTWHAILQPTMVTRTIAPPLVRAQEAAPAPMIPPRDRVPPQDRSTTRRSDDQQHHLTAARDAEIALADERDTVCAAGRRCPAASSRMMMAGSAVMVTRPAASR